jgi:NAD/NADP transhydrogenase alpha subunit
VIIECAGEWKSRSLETFPGEGRIAASPESVKKLKTLGFEVVVQAGATLSRIPDSEFEKAGAASARLPMLQAPMWC